MEVLEVVRLALERLTPSALAISIVLGLISGFVIVGRFGVPLRHFILTSILTIFLLVFLAVDAALNHNNVRQSIDGSTRATNGIGGLMLYLIFLACASAGAKTQQEIDNK